MADVEGQPEESVRKQLWLACFKENDEGLEAVTRYMQVILLEMVAAGAMMEHQPAKVAQAFPDLVLSGSNFEYHLGTGRTALMNCCDARSPRTAAKLVSAGADVMANDEDGQTPAMFAAANGDLACLEALLLSPAGPLCLQHVPDASLVAEEGRVGWNVAHYAAYHGHSNVLEWLASARSGLEPTQVVALLTARAAGEGYLPADLNEADGIPETIVGILSRGKGRPAAAESSATCVVTSPGSTTSSVAEAGRPYLSWGQIAAVVVMAAAGLYFLRKYARRKDDS